METDERELQAMIAVSSALKELDDDEQFRVLQWAYNKYLGMTDAQLNRKSKPGVIPGKTSDEELVGEESQAEDAVVYETFADMLDASGADGEAQRVLIAAYWIQSELDQSSWKSYEVNKLLKDTGNQVKYMTNPVAQLMARKPKLVVQVSKTSSKNGKGSKTMKLTSEGMKAAVAMLKES